MQRKVHVSLFFPLIIPCTSGCGLLLKNPTISVSNVSLTSLSIGDLSLAITLAVDNPNPVGIRLKTVMFDVYFQEGEDWTYLSHVEQQGLAIRPGKNEVKVSVTVKNIELVRAGLGIITAGKVDLKILGSAAPDLFLIAPAVPFSYTTTVHLPGSGSGK